MEGRSIPRDAARVALLVIAAASHGLWVASLAANAGTPELERRDFIAFHEAGQDLDAPDLYAPRPGGFPFLHPPPVAALAGLAAGLPPLGLYALLVAVDALALVALVVALGGLRDPHADAPLDLVALAALASAPWIVALILGQPIAALVAAWAVGAALLERRPGLAGLAFSLCALKPPLLLGPLALVLARLARGRGADAGARRAALGLGLGVAGLALLSIPVGLGRWAEWVAAVGRAQAAVSDGGLPLFRQHTLLASLLASVPRPLAVALGATAAVGLGVWTLRVVWRRVGDGQLARALAPLALATLALSPYAYYYDALLLLVPAAVTWLAPGRPPEPWRRALLGVALATFALQHVSFFALQRGSPLGLVTTFWLVLELGAPVTELRTVGSVVPGAPAIEPAQPGP